MAKSKKRIYAKRAKTSRAENFGISSGSFMISDVRQAFTKLKQTFIKAPVLDHFDPEYHI